MSLTRLVSGKVVSSSWLPDQPSTPTLLPVDHPVVAGLVVLVDSPQTPQPAPVPRTPVPRSDVAAAALPQTPVPAPVAPPTMPVPVPDMPKIASSPAPLWVIFVTEVAVYSPPTTMASPSAASAVTGRAMVDATVAAVAPSAAPRSARRVRGADGSTAMLGSP